MKTHGFPMIIIFVIILMIITVMAWKSCSSEEQNTESIQSIDTSLAIRLD